MRIGSGILAAVLTLPLAWAAEAQSSVPVAIDGTLCASGIDASMPASLRSGLAAELGEVIAASACARLFDSSGEERYRRHAVALIPFRSDEVGLKLLGLRSDGGWTNLTPSGLPPYDPAKAKIWIQQDQSGEMPRLLLEWGERGTTTSFCTTILLFNFTKLGATNPAGQATEHN